MHMPAAVAITGFLLLGSTLAASGQEADASARPAIASSGCGASVIEPGRFLDESIDVDGFTRRWAAYVPPVHHGRTPTPVWLYLHPSGGNRNSAAEALPVPAQELGFVAVTPQARGGG